jgi:DNA-binding transcriptional LysR family regulator
LEAIKEMVKEGTGITVLAPWAVRKELDEKTLISLPLGKRKLKRNWGLLRALDHKPSLAEETFATLCIKAANNLSSLASAVAVMTYVLWPVGLESDLLAVAV